MTEVVTAVAVVASRAVPTSPSTQAVTLKQQDIVPSQEHMIIPLKLPVANIMEEVNSRSTDRVTTKAIQAVDILVLEESLFRSLSTIPYKTTNSFRANGNEYFKTFY